MAEERLLREDILRLTRELDFLGEDCWLTSGAALVLYGVKESTRDIDLICTTELADRLEKQGVPYRLDGLDGTRIFTVNSQVEVLENWHTDEVIELCGLRAASLLSIRKQKEALGREKDLADIRLIDEFLEKRDSHMIQLETERLILRDYRPADLEDYIRLKSDAETMYYLQDIQFRSRQEGEKDFAEVLADAASPERCFVFLRAERKDTGEQLGSVGYTVRSRTPLGKLVDAGYFYVPRFWGQGYGTEAFSRVLEFAFLEDNVYRVTTGCLQENKGSERVMQKCGMVLEAERPDWEWYHGAMKTRLEYRLLRQEFQKQRL